MATKPANQSKRGKKRESKSQSGSRQGGQLGVRSRLIASVLAASLLPVIGMASVVAYFASQQNLALSLIHI